MQRLWTLWRHEYDVIESCDVVAVDDVTNWRALGTFPMLRIWHELLSVSVRITVYSALVRNTVVRATFKVNGKPPILGSLSPLTPWPIDLKFHKVDYVGDMKPQAKNGKNRPRRAGPAKGWNVKVYLGYFFIFIEFLARRWRSQFCTDQRRFCPR